MKEYILIIILLIIILFLLRPEKSNYNSSTSSSDWHVTFFQVGKDIDPAVTTTVPSSDSGISIDAINYKMWSDPSKSSYWGVRKVLQDGGGGAVSYLTFADDTAATAALTQQAGGLQSYNYNGIDYLIPTVVFVKKSKVSPIYQTNITSLAAGSYHTAVISSGLVYCWGYNYLGQLGVGNTTNYNTPQIVPIPGVPIAVACGWHHTAVISNGSIYCWGFNLTGQLGIGTSTEGEYTPQKVTTFIGNPIAIACGHSHTAVISDGAIYCWGSNSNGQLGNGNNTNYSTPQRVTISGTPTAIACGADHTAAISNGSVYCWGKNFSGQLGTGNTTDKNTPQLVTIPFNGFIVTAVACGSDHTAAIAGGYIFCWGYNGYGQLGLGNNTRYTTPQIVPIPGTVIGTSIACGDSHTASISNGAIYCWGLNNNGQLGIGNTTSYNTPRKVTIPGIPLIVSCGLDYTTAISGGSVYCWGYNGYGQFGNGDNYSYYTPKLSLVTL